MTKGDFLKWLDQFRHMQNIRDKVEMFKYSPDELDTLKDQLETNGKLFMKEKYKRRLTWGQMPTTGFEDMLRGLRVRCWPYRIEFHHAMTHAAYEVRIYLDTRDPNTGEPTILAMREMIAYETMASARSAVDVIQHVIRHALHKMATEHVDSHLKFG